MHKILLAFAGMVLLSFAVGAQEKPSTEWKVEHVALDPDPLDGVGSGRLQASIRASSGEIPFPLTVPVVLTKMGDWFVSGDRLVVMGEAGRASAVVILDLANRRETDWFYCYSPQRVSEDRIAYIEYYLAHGAFATDVVLVYDLSKSPAENRLEKNPSLRFPPQRADAPVRVGIPVFPESNAKQRSYDNHVLDPAQSLGILGTPILALSPTTLVVSVMEGFDARTARGYLAVIDLSAGLGNPSIRRVDIRTDNLPRPGANPNKLQINRMEAASPTAIRLFVPEAEYGVASVVVDVSGK